MVTLMLLRRMPEYEAVVREHRWSNQLTVRSIRDNTFTILGTGNIGNQCGGAPPRHGEPRRSSA